MGIRSFLRGGTGSGRGDNPHGYNADDPEFQRTRAQHFGYNQNAPQRPDSIPYPKNDSYFAVKQYMKDNRSMDHMYGSLDTPTNELKPHQQQARAKYSENAGYNKPAYPDEPSKPNTGKWAL